MPPMTWFSSPADAADAAGRGRLPRRPGDRHDDVPRRRAGEAAAGRGAGRRRQDRAGQGGRPGDRRRAGAAAVLRGARRGARALRVELQEAAAPHPGPQGDDQAWDETHDDIFTDEFLLTRPLLTAIRREEPTVLLIDEVDKTDVEVEGLLLEVLSDFQVTIPELGTRRRRTPAVRRAHLQRHPRAVRGGQAALPLPAPRLPRRRARARDRRVAGARPRGAGRRAAGRDGRAGCATWS